MLHAWQASSFNGGDLIIIANMVLWAIYTACLRLRPDIHPMTFMLAMAVVAGLGNLPFALLEHAFDYRLQYTGLTLVTLLYSAFITTLLAYFAWNRGIDIVGAPRASAFLHTIPVFSAVACHHDPGRDHRAVSSLSASP